MTADNQLSPQLLANSRKLECEADGMYFNRYFFKQQNGSKMLVSPHHILMQQALERTMLPTWHPEYIGRLIINIPPGYTKTTMAVINYIARGLALNPRNRFLHLSYSHALALQNSASARNIVALPEFQDMWQIKARDDADAKAIWWTHEGGGVYATSSAGQVTGFRAGHMDEGVFTGALLIDDPVKPDDADSEVKRKGINERYNTTIASRLAIETVPVIVTMQRIHWDDLSGYLLRGGSGEKWHHLNLPVVTDRSVEYPHEYTHGIPITHQLPEGWLWEAKHNDSNAKALQSHRRRYWAQYMQKPIKDLGSLILWSDELINAAKTDAPTGEPTRTVVSVDPAVTDTEDSDDHGVMVASKHSETMYTVDSDHTLKGSPLSWARKAIAVYEIRRASAIVIEVNQGGDMCETTLRNAGFKGKVLRVRASKGKVIRAEPVAALYEMGYVKHRPGLEKLEYEMINMNAETGKVDGKSPNRLDAMVWALTELAGIGTDLRDALEMAMGVNKSE